MKILACLVLFIFCCSVFADTYVQGYYRKNGTYVPGHYRSSPNGTKNDNWSTQGNYNPYTGKAGTKKPDYYPNSYGNYGSKKKKSGF